MNEYNSFLEVNTQLLIENVSQILGSLPKTTQFIPVLKADAYGLGAGEIARVMAKTFAMSCFAVAHVSEGVSLRAAGVAGEIMVLGATPPHLMQTALCHQLTLAVGRAGMLTEIAEIAKAQRVTANIELKLETGLNRYGLKPGDELAQFCKEYHALEEETQGNIILSGVFTHLASPANQVRSRMQYDLLQQGVAQLKQMNIYPKRVHIAASEASELSAQYYLDAVRLGRRLFFDHPTKPTGGIKEVATWYTFVTNVRKVKKGEYIGYGDDGMVERDCTIATLAVGYADGLNELLCEKHAPVLIKGQMAKLITCCMDQCLVDVTGICCTAGDRATFFGQDEFGNVISAQELSLLVGDKEGCGLTSALTKRVCRVYR